MGLGLIAGLTKVGNWLGSTAGQGLMSGIGMGMQVGGGLFSGIRAKKQHKRNKELLNMQNEMELNRMEVANEYQKAAAAQSQQYAIDMFNHQAKWNEAMRDEQREYDLPANEKRRLEEAGLNPALMYSGGASGGSGIGASGASAMGAAEQGAPATLAPMGLQVALQAQSIQAQNELTRAQTQKIRVDTMKESSLGMAGAAADLAIKQGIKTLNETQSETNRTLSALNKASTNEKNQIIKNLGVQYDKWLQELDILMINKEIKQETKQAEIDRIVSNSWKAYGEYLDTLEGVKNKISLRNEIEERIRYIAYDAYTRRIAAKASERSAQAQTDQATASLWNAETERDRVNAQIADINDMIKTRGVKLSLEEQRNNIEIARLSIQTVLNSVEVGSQFLPTKMMEKTITHHYPDRGAGKQTRTWERTPWRLGK